MNSKSGDRSIWLSPLLGLSLLILNYYAALVGYYAGKHLSFGFLDVISNAGNPSDVKLLLPGILYGVLTFLVGLVVVSASLWRVFLKDPKRGLIAQLSPANFLRYLPSYLAIGFFAGFAWFSADLIIGMIHQIARL